MSDLKALRREIAGKLAAKAVKIEPQRDKSVMLTTDISAIESALLQYAEAVLGEPSEGMIERGNFSAASANPHDHTVRGMFNAMASQRLKEIK